MLQEQEQSEGHNIVYHMTPVNDMMHSQQYHNTNYNLLQVSYQICVFYNQFRGFRENFVPLPLNRFRSLSSESLNSPSQTACGLDTSARDEERELFKVSIQVKRGRPTPRSKLLGRTRKQLWW